MCHIDITAHSIPSVCIQLCLKNVREHLYVVAPRPIALAEQRIQDIVVREPIAKCHFWKKLTESIRSVRVEPRYYFRRAAHPHHLCNQPHFRFRIITHSDIIIIITQPDGSGKTGRNMYVRLMKDADIQLRSAETAWNLHGKPHVHASCPVDNRRSSRFGHSHVRKAFQYSFIDGSPYATRNV